MHRLLAAAVLYLILTGNVLGQEKQDAPGKSEPAPQPRLLPEMPPLPPGWSVDPASGRWTDREGTQWLFDGLRWRVLWIDRKWYPVIPPGPVPMEWRREDLGQGWSEVLPPSSRDWHIIPPDPSFMPPLFFAPLWPSGPGAGPTRPRAGLLGRRWR